MTTERVWVCTEDGEVCRVLRFVGGAHAYEHEPAMVWVDEGGEGMERESEFRSPARYRVTFRKRAQLRSGAHGKRVTREALRMDVEA